MLDWPKLALEQPILLTVNSSLWEAVIVDADPADPAAQLVRLVSGESVLKPKHMLRLSECVPRSKWARERGYQILLVDGKWY